MIERPLMTPDEFKSMSKGNFVVMKTGSNPIKSKLALFTKWNITFEEPYTIKERPELTVEYVMKREILKVIASTDNMQIKKKERKD